MIRGADDTHTFDALLMLYNVTDFAGSATLLRRTMRRAWRPRLRWHAALLCIGGIGGCCPMLVKHVLV
jgi:hypothetical protein